MIILPPIIPPSTRFHIIDGWSDDPLDVDGDNTTSFAAYKNAIGDGHYVVGENLDLKYHAIFVIERLDGALLVEFRTWCNDWVFPGGAVEAGESPRGAAAREAEEELGIFVPFPDRSAELHIPDTRTKSGSIIKAFMITEWGGNIPDVDNDNQAPLGWLTAEEMLEHDLESQRYIAEAICALRNADSAYGRQA